MEYYLIKLLDNDIQLLKAVQKTDWCQDSTQNCIPRIDKQIQNLVKVKQGIGKLPARL